MPHYSEPVMDLIRKRRSWRSYLPEALSEGLRSQILEFIAAMDPPPFGSSLRFALVDSPLPGRTRTPGTYGVIKGARHTLVGVMKPSAMAFEDFGYCFESLILKCTDLGLGTCWMGATFSRDYYGSLVGLQDDEFIPILSPVGHAAEKRSFLDSIFSASSGSRNRRPFAELFFRDSLSTPLSPQDAGEYAEALEMVRFAPSALNKQPWRVVKTADGYHFLLCRTAGYRRLFPKVDLQRIDMGIAMFHFASTASALGLPGKLTRVGTAPAGGPGGIEYRASWFPGS
ncbi:MAG: nitroreductase family protein [Desulfomonilia bacterium]|jgi:nitroreductase